MGRSPGRGLGESVKSHSDKGNEIKAAEPIVVLQSTAGEVVIREVHDWELDIVSEVSESYSRSLAYTSAGIAAGFLQNFANLLVQRLREKPVSWLDLTFSFLCVISATVCGATWYLSSKVEARSKLVKAQIMARPLRVR